MQTPTNTIQKAKIKDSRLEVIYEEFFSEENYSNTIDKKCAQIIHADLQTAFDRLKAHLAIICEMPEGDIHIHATSDHSDFNNYVITGYSHGGSAESAGVTIVGQKLLKSGKVLNLVTPFIQFEDEEAYKFASDLAADIDACDEEVKEYLFDGKWGIKQLSLDFDAPEGLTVEMNVGKKKRGKKKIEITDEAA